jgi:predicted nucleic-acid-binding protein
LSAFIDTNVLVRHLTGNPPEIAARATAFIRDERELFLTDLVAAETVHVLESFYEAPREEVALALRSVVAFRSIVCIDPALLLRAVEVYETERIDFAEAYLVAPRAPGSARSPRSTGRSIGSTRSSASSPHGSDHRRGFLVVSRSSLREALMGGALRTSTAALIGHAERATVSSETSCTAQSLFGGSHVPGPCSQLLDLPRRFRHR